MIINYVITDTFQESEALLQLINDEINLPVKDSNSTKTFDVSRCRNDGKYYFRSPIDFYPNLEVNQQILEKIEQYDTELDAENVNWFYNVSTEMENIEDIYL